MKAKSFKAILATVGIVAVGLVLAQEDLTNGLKAGVSAPTFQANASDGKSYSLKSLTEKGPAFLYFVKDGCSANPFSVKYFNRLYNAYKGKVRFIAVMNSGKDAYASFVKDYGAPFPGLLDPDEKIIQAYSVHHSQTVVMVGKDGKVAKTFQGYGKDSLSQLNASLAGAAKSAVLKVDLAGAPSGTAYG